MINSAPCEINKSVGFYTTFARKIILAGEIKGVETYYVELGIGKEQIYLPEEKQLSILLFLGGEGVIARGDMEIPVGEPGVYISGLKRKYSIKGGEENLSYLEIVMDLTEQDILELEGNEASFPYQTLYSECRQYRESIKSEQTISRMILPEDIVPRVCIGTVRTTGPDEVASHTHPMLEQLFLGLEGNDVSVFADSDETRFRENELLHIPPGSDHGVRVEEGKTLNYLWVDIFSDRSKMEYMKNNHTIIEE